MYYLKCNHCGFDNPLKTEFVTFCVNCGKKLENNFPDWHRNHPGSGFNEFQEQIAKPETEPLHLKKKSRIPIIAGIIAGSVCCFLIFLFSRSEGDLKSFLLPENTPASIADGKWQRFTYGKSGLSVESPEKLTQITFEIPENMKALVQESETYLYRPSRGFQVIVTSIMYREKVRVNLSGAATGAMNELINQPGTSNLEYKQSPLMYNDIPGIFLEGTFHTQGKFMRFNCALYGKESKLWQVMITLRANDENGIKAAERVVQSVEINYFTKSI